MDPILLAVGLFVFAIGAGSFFYPRLTALINLPLGDKNTKPIFASIIGIIIIIAGFIL